MFWNVYTYMIEQWERDVCVISEPGRVGIESEDGSVEGVGEVDKQFWQI